MPMKPTDQEAERKQLAEAYAGLSDDRRMELAADPDALTEFGLMFVGRFIIIPEINKEIRLC